MFSCGAAAVGLQTLLSVALLLPLLLLQDKLSQEQEPEEEMKQPDRSPGEKVPDLEEEQQEEEEDGGDKTKELVERLKTLEVSPASSCFHQLTWLWSLTVCLCALRFF